MAARVEVGSGILTAWVLIFPVLIESIRSFDSFLPARFNLSPSSGWAQKLAMKIREIEISGYRSLKDIRLKLGDVTIVVGPNGCGKSNIYQAVQMMASAASGQFARRIVEEGGMKSIVWAGRRSKLEDSVRVRMAVNLEELAYELEFGFIPKDARLSDGAYGIGLALFAGDPDIKQEKVSLNTGSKSVSLLERKRGSITARNMDGKRAAYPVSLPESESVLSELREPHKFPELSVLRQEFLSWRFYHDFRTDLHSPIRQPQLGTLTPVLSHDGVDLAAAIATIRPLGDKQLLEELIDRAFPGSVLKVEDVDNELVLTFSTPGVDRDLGALELSDGTLQYFCLLAALLSPRPAPFLVLNEPETSIHPDLYVPLAELIVAASKYSQIFLTTHSFELAGYLKQKTECRTIELEKISGATCVRGARVVEDDDDDDDEIEQRRRELLSRNAVKSERSKGKSGSTLFDELHADDYEDSDEN